MNDAPNGAGPRLTHSGLVGITMAAGASIANAFHVNPILVAPLVAAVSHIGGLLIARWLKPQRVSVPGNVGTLLLEARRLTRQLHSMSNKVSALLAESEWLASEHGVTHESLPRDRTDRARPGAP